MTRTSDFFKIKGVARIGWEMRTETPLTPFRLQAAKSKAP